jgi:hypothetical protein
VVRCGRCGGYTFRLFESASRKKLIDCNKCGFMDEWN